MAIDTGGMSIVIKYCALAFGVLVAPSRKWMAGFAQFGEDVQKRRGDVRAATVAGDATLGDRVQRLRGRTRCVQ